MLPLWNTWITSPVFVPAGWPLVLSPASSVTERAHILPTQTSSLPSTLTPHGMLSPIRADHIDGASRPPRWPHDVLDHVRCNELELLHDGDAIGKLRPWGL